MINETHHHIVAGRVQGVGYRATIKRHAQQLGLHGTTHNLPDGNVDIIVQGPPEKLKVFLEKIEQEPGAGQVTHIHTTKLSPTQKSQTYSDFVIQ